MTTASTSTAIYVTRHYSGMQNREDRLSLGNYEHEGNASLFRTRLPPGYTVRGGEAIDPRGYACVLVLDEAGRPVIRSLTGPCPDAVLALTPER